MGDVARSERCPIVGDGTRQHLFVLGQAECECGEYRQLPDGSLAQVRAEPPTSTLVDPWDQNRVLRAVQFGFATLREQLPPGAEFGVFVLVPKAGDEKPRVLAAQSGARHKVAFSVLQWCRGALQDASPEIQRAAGIAPASPSDPARIILPRR